MPDDYDCSSDTCDTSSNVDTSTDASDTSSDIDTSSDCSDTDCSDTSSDCDLSNDGSDDLPESDTDTSDSADYDRYFMLEGGKIVYIISEGNLTESLKR